MKNGTNLGERRSYPREIVLEVLRSACDHPDAAAVYERARAIKPDISKGTVYRNLKLLGENNAIITLETEKKCLHYDGNTAPHRHFICKECGEITDLFTEIETPAVLNEMGFTVTEEKCVYYGYCDKCKNKKEKVL